MNNTVIIETPTARTIRAITAAAKRRHADRLILTKPVERLRVMAQLARQHGYWKHVDWDRIETHLGRRTT